MTLTIIILYLVLVLAIGLLSHRLFRGTGEDYFVATRTIGPFILLMSLFGTHMTAFSLLGASGESRKLHFQFTCLRQLAHLCHWLEDAIDFIPEYVAN